MKVCANLSVDFAGCLVYNSHLQMELVSNGMFDMDIGWLSICSVLSSELLLFAVSHQFCFNFLLRSSFILTIRRTSSYNKAFFLL